VRVWVEPASRMESFLETIYGLAHDGRTNAKGMPNPLQLAVFSQAYFDVNHVARPPLAVQRVLFGILAPIGRLLGYRPDHPYPYPEAPPAAESELPGTGAPAGHLLIQRRSAVSGQAPAPFYDSADPTAGPLTLPRGRPDYEHGSPSPSRSRSRPRRLPWTDVTS
jgi:hypothetical protein